jgi:hypothetical protein
MTAIRPDEADAVDRAAESRMLALASDISRLRIENLRLNDRTHSLAGHLKELTIDNHVLGDTIANLDRVIDRYNHEVASALPIIAKSRLDIRRIKVENARLRQALLADPSLIDAARSLQSLQSETSAVNQEALTIKTPETAGLREVRALINDKIQVLGESQIDLQRELLTLQTALDVASAIEDRKQRLRDVLSQVDPAMIDLEPPLVEAMLDAVELFGELPPAPLDVVSIENDYLLDAEIERMAALAAARLTQALLDEEAIERERREQEALLELARRERERRDQEERDRAAAERAARRRRRHKPVIAEFAVREPDLPAVEREQSFSDDEMTRDRFSSQLEIARMRENQELLAKLKEQQSAQEAERDELLARIAAASEIPLLVTTMPDSVVTIIEATTQEDVLSKMHPVIAERFCTQSPPPEMVDSDGQTNVSSQNIEQYRELWRRRIQEKKHREELKEKYEDLMKRMADILPLIRQNQSEISEKDAQAVLLKTKIDAVRAEQAARLGIRIKNPTKAKKEAAIREEVLKRQAELDRLNTRNKSLEDRLAELQKRRDMLTYDISDMENREKPEIRKLHGAVTESQTKIEHSTDRLGIVRAHLAEKRKDLEAAQNWQASHPVRDLRLARFKLERRQSKWRSFLKNSKDTPQNLEFFSAANSQRRETLSQELQKAESEHVDAVQTLEELEAYSDLLAALITEDIANWRAANSASAS